MRKNYILECCVDSVESAVTAAAGGADRVELCSNLIIGGTTPTLALYHTVREHADIRIHALLRPRFGDFLYSDLEFEMLLKEVSMFRAAGAEGVVIGCLTADGSIDTEQMKRLIEAAGDMHITLHRAFDMCSDYFAALRTADSLGIKTILTSGGQDCCLAGADLLKELDAYCKAQLGGRVQIMAGAGVNASVIGTLLQNTGLTAFHMSGKKIVPSGMRYRNPSVHMGMPGFSEYEIFASDEAAIREADAVLSKTDYN